MTSKDKKVKKPKKKIPLADQYNSDGDWKDEKRLVIGAIRRLFRQSPQFKEVSEASRVELPKHKKDGTLAKKPHVKRTCEICGELFSSTNIAIDHIKPMVPLHLTNEDMDYNDIVKAICCKKENLQRICNPKKGKKNKPTFLQFCHQKKTHKENFFRSKWQEYFKTINITAKNDKAFIELAKGDVLEKQWSEEYEVFLVKQWAELEAKEERKRLKLLKKK